LLACSRPHSRCRGSYITKHTKFGKTPHPKDRWGHTRAYMQSYGDPGDTEAVIALFQSADLPNEVEAARWLLKHDSVVP
jgi:hypothetical protein